MRLSFPNFKGKNTSCFLSSFSIDYCIGERGLMSVGVTAHATPRDILATRWLDSSSNPSSCDDCVPCYSFVIRFILYRYLQQSKNRLVPSSLSSSSSSFVCRSDAFNVQLCVLRVAHFSRRLGEQTRPIRGFWKRNNISNRSRAREHHHQSIEAKRQASVRRRAVLKRLHEIAKFILRLLRRQSNGAKHRLLHVAAVDAQRATANFHAVVHQVVRDRAGVG
mmetsp:Transcript_3912/g.14198  ORF Transcript_3912/g.14198 Transcript_3912/m.14198 type:complete len:221 (+) Transcript_3912:585-1247(+)